MKRQIFITKWRNMEYEDIPVNHINTDNYSLKELKENWEKRRNTEIKIFIPATEPFKRWCNQPQYQRVDAENMFVCSCLVEIGD